MQRPAGLSLRGGFWHIQKTVALGAAKRRIRETTHFREEEVDEANRYLEQRIYDVQTELRQGPKKREHLFMDAAVMYVLSLERRGKATGGTEVILKRVMDEIGNLPLSHVHMGSLGPWIDAQDGKLKSSTVKRTLGVVAAVLNHAARVLRDGNTPWLSTAVPKLEAPDWNDQRPPYKLTWEEQDKLVSQLPKHLVAPALFSVATGAREQEVASLKWSQECEVTGLPPGSIWWVPPEVRKGNARKTRSEQQGRYLVCNAMARLVLDSQRQNGSEYVFPRPRPDKDGNLVRTERLNNHGFRTARAKAGLPIRWHDLRHTFGERAAAAGIPWDYRKVLLAHEIKDITGHYSAPGLKLLLEEAEKITRQGAVVLRVVTQNVTQTKRPA
ncbi:MAG: tyrosine-type recombinase/integrase [Chromatiaceae bacterium]|jgi:integrase|nr:tyrosine-type recombinase/integrase [Chromatiaceae bacterium]MCF8017663.1 tyrosine-type recombinase/integrase [Chromatiaceae bacterium]